MLRRVGLGELPADLVEEEKELLLLWLMVSVVVGGAGAEGHLARMSRRLASASFRFSHEGVSRKVGKRIICELGVGS